ncbi:MAG: DUF433 domain-containing protein [Candidatus Eremiobacteraeota bacterium]|nr:DUF433 domain-containing protein [Candidatus Eremiobacteraeota bacterium]MBC5804142.1 DUF433 domain-containing protein [Candidatus Eremiobacteraeota bacterium]MBC5821898.1 DUF433 domain-containing protein [Candidatus Eremiobacteraeota bacterium]
MVTHDRIEINPEVMLDKPVIRGTRITVEHILRRLSEGASAEELVAGHPRLDVRDISAAQAYAADYLANEEIVFA